MFFQQEADAKEMKLIVTAVKETKESKSKLFMTLTNIVEREANRIYGMMPNRHWIPPVRRRKETDHLSKNRQPVSDGRYGTDRKKCG